MKTRNIILTGILLIQISIQSCTKEYLKIEGEGPIVSETLNLSNFSNVAIQGVDNVHIQYGTEQKVEVKGHANIIDRIKKDVRNNTWYIELKNGRYGEYELTYYLTLPKIHEIENNGTGDVIMDNEMTQESIRIRLNGTGDYYGFSMTVEDCEIETIGTGSAEVTANSSLDVRIEGTGSVYYKGHPEIKNSISGTGKLISAN